MKDERFAHRRTWVKSSEILDFRGEAPSAMGTVYLITPKELKSKKEILMSKVIIYHNPKCSKSREAIALLNKEKVDYKIKEYLKEGLEDKEIMDIINLLGDSWQSIIRVKEKDFIGNPFNIDDPNLVKSNLISNPKLLERPIIVFRSSALIARPIEKLEEALK